MMRKKALILSTTALGLFAFTILPAAAQTQFSIENIGSAVGLGSADLKDTVVNIIQWVLGILALLAVVFIIWGGFKWLTSSGDETRIESAKKTISAAVIGLIIVLLAWAIVIFVAGTTANVTTVTT